MGTSQSAMCRIGSFLSDVYEDVHLQNLTMGETKPGNLTQIHDEIIKKLECMAHAWQHDTHISGYPIPFCCKPTTLCKMYTMEELRAAGVVTMSTNLEGSDIGTGWPAGSEFEESDITDTEGIHDATEESTDTEMAQHTSDTLMINTDREKIRLEDLAREQDHAMARALKQVLDCHLEEVQAMASATHDWGDGCSSHKCHSASHEDNIKRSREESPEAGIMPKERGCSLHCKSKTDLKLLALPTVQHPASRSFTPCMGCPHSRSATPSRWHSQSRSDTPSIHCSHSRSKESGTWCPCSRSSMPNQSWHRDSTRTLPENDQLHDRRGPWKSHQLSPRHRRLQSWSHWSNKHLPPNATKIHHTRPLKLIPWSLSSMLWGPCTVRHMMPGWDIWLPFHLRWPS